MALSRLKNVAEAQQVATTGWTTSAVALAEAAANGGNNTAIQADATSGSGADDFIGFVEAPGSVTHSGEVEGAQFVAGLSISGGQTCFLSKTPGAITTDVSAFVSGDVVYPVAIVKDASSYVGGTPANSKADVIISIGQPVTL